MGTCAFNQPRLAFRRLKDLYEPVYNRSNCHFLGWKCLHVSCIRHVRTRWTLVFECLQSAMENGPTLAYLISSNQLQQFPKDICRIIKYCTFCRSLDAIINLMPPFYLSIRIIDATHSRLGTAFLCFPRLAAKIDECGRATQEQSTLHAWKWLKKRAITFPMSILPLSIVLNPRHRSSIVRPENQKFIDDLIKELARSFRFPLQRAHVLAPQIRAYRDTTNPFDLSYRDTS